MFFQKNETVKNICIIGGGHAAICLAIREMRHTRGKADVYLLERASLTGIGYSAETADTNHHLNLQAGRISILREDPKHFMRWAMKKKGLRLQDSSPVQRQLFGEYCVDTLHEEALKCPYVNLYVGRANVTDLTEHNDKYVTISAEDPTLKMATESRGPEKFTNADIGKKLTLPEKFDYALVATGHLEVKVPKALKNYSENTESLLIDQYHPSAYPIIDKVASTISENNIALIIGSGLAALDPIVSIAERRLRNCGSLEERRQIIAAMPNFILCSRHANRHPTYSPDHKHRSFHISRPDILDRDKITLAGLEIALPGIWEKASKEIMQQDAVAIMKNPDLIHERIMKAMEPYVAELATKMSAYEVKSAFGKWGSLITSMRIGVVPKIGNLIDELEKAGKLIFIEGELAEYKNGHAIIQLWQNGAAVNESMEIESTFLVNSIGRNFDYSKTTSVFWNNVDCLPHQKTGMGIEVTEDSRIVRSDGTAYQRIYACGVMCIGDEIERHGRLGAFSQSQGPIKTRATQIIGTINREISGPHPKVQQYFDFIKQHSDLKEPLIAFFPKQSGSFYNALHYMQQSMQRSIGNMSQHLYAENNWQDPAVELAEIEKRAAKFIEEIPAFAKSYGVPPTENKHLRAAANILLELYIDKAMKRCCDVSKDPSTIESFVKSA